MNTPSPGSRPGCHELARLGSFACAAAVVLLIATRCAAPPPPARAAGEVAVPGATTPARTAGEDRDAVRTLVDAFHLEDLGRDALCVRVSPSGNYVAIVKFTQPLKRGESCAYADCTLRIWPFRDGRVVRGDAPPLFETKGRCFLDHAPQWSHAGDRLAFTLRRHFGEDEPTVDDFTRLLVWSPSAGVSEVGVLRKPRGSLVTSSPAWNPQDTVVALASGWYEPLKLDLFELATGDCVEKSFDANTHGGPEIAWSPAGLWIAMVITDGVYIYDTATERCTRVVARGGTLYNRAWTGPQWDDSGTRIGLALGNALTVDLPKGTVHEWKTTEHVDALTWIPGGSHWFAITDQSGPENDLARAFRALTRECSEPPRTYSGCVVDGDGRVVETVFTTTLTRPLSMLLSDYEQCWFELPWTAAALLGTVR